MAEFIDCRNCEAPNCRGCNVYILEQALKSGRLDGLKGENNTIRIPAADVRPVVHGSWIVTDHGDYQLIECDQCHAQMWNHQSELPNYCYECGADMRKVVEIDHVKEDAGASNARSYGK